MGKKRRKHEEIRDIDDLLGIHDSAEGGEEAMFRDLNRRTSQQCLTIREKRETTQQIDMGIDKLIAKHNPSAHKGKRVKTTVQH